MRILSLSQSVLNPDSLPSSPPFNTHLSLSSSLHKQSPKLSFHKPTSLSPRCQRATSVMCEALFNQFLRKASNKKDNTALCYLDTKASKTKAETIQHSLYGLLEKNVFERNCCIATDFLSNATVGNIIKFTVLLGLLAIQDTGPALAAPDIASGLQSLPFLGDLGDISTGFASAFLLIFFSELGDKTFFIAALLAARNSSAVVFTGTFGALAVMTIISVVLGRTFHYVDAALPFRFGETDLPIDDLAAVCLLVYFGVSTLLDATSSDGPKAEDEQKEAELAVSKFSGNGAGILAAANTVISTFVLVFVAEWGDKSFFSTIALAAASSPLGVIGGALAGHAAATLIAVLGGSLLGTFLSEKVIAYVGGALFLVFAAVTLIEIAT